MADSLADLELRILLLPPISRGTHLAGPALHARRLVELWGVEGDDDLPLTEGFRLLDSDVVTGVTLRTLYASDREYINPHPRYWEFPSLADLLPELRDLSWQAMLTGALLVEAAKGVGGKRYPVVLPAELCGWRRTGISRGSPATVRTNSSMCASAEHRQSQLRRLGETRFQKPS